MFTIMKKETWAERYAQRLVQLGAQEHDARARADQAVEHFYAEFATPEAAAEAAVCEHEGATCD